MIFVDTGVFYARLDRADRHHAAANAFFREVAEPLVTTREVVFETQAMLLKASRVLPSADLRPESQKFLESIDRGLATVIAVTEDEPPRGSRRRRQVSRQGFLAVRRTELRRDGAAEDHACRLLRRALPSVRKVRRVALIEA
jgi:predicted nucleic acid-binding protein